MLKFCKRTQEAPVSRKRWQQGKKTYTQLRTSRICLLWFFFWLFRHSLKVCSHCTVGECFVLWTKNASKQIICWFVKWLFNFVHFFLSPKKDSANEYVGSVVRRAQQVFTLYKFSFRKILIKIPKVQVHFSLNIVNEVASKFVYSHLSRHFHFIYSGLHFIFRPKRTACSLWHICPSDNNNETRYKRKLRKHCK